MTDKRSGEHDHGLPMPFGRAKHRWPRNAISKFTFPQLPTPGLRKLGRPRAEGEVVRMVMPGLPVAGDITAIPNGGDRKPQLRARGQAVEPLFIYPPDTRRIFYDTTYPWRCCGLVTSPNGHGSGALVGPRHLLTASHVIQWDPNNTAGWVKFQPDYNNGDVLPSANAIEILSYEQIGNPQSESDVAEDFVVCVLDQRLGDQLGWLGTMEYDDSWDQENVWVHVGYPDDLGGGSQPVFQGPISIYNSWHPGFFETGSDRDLETFASLDHGDSGSPIFGWFSDGPHVIGVVSGQGTLPPVYSDLTSRTGNWCAGGSMLPSLVSSALSQYP